MIQQMEKDKRNRQMPNKMWVRKAVRVI